MNARFVPVETWPGEKRRPSLRRNSPFCGSWQNTLVTLDRELEHLGAHNVVVQAYLSTDDIRLDGWPRAGVSPREPGVIVSFETKNGALSFPCDTYTHYRDNLRAIALALAALRAVERYGVTRHQEQYKGWAKLPAAPASGEMRVEDALCFISLHGNGGGPVDRSIFRTCYRSAAARLHPDNQETGNTHLFHLLGEARKVLEDTYGWRATL